MTEREIELGKRFIKRKWEHMTDAQRFDIAQQIAGVRHYNVFLSAMNSWLGLSTEKEDYDRARQVVTSCKAGRARRLHLQG